MVDYPEVDYVECWEGGEGISFIEGIILTYLLHHRLPTWPPPCPPPYSRVTATFHNWLSSPIDVLIRGNYDRDVIYPFCSVCQCSLIVVVACIGMENHSPWHMATWIAVAPC
jgi:hypothetical protein